VQQQREEVSRMAFLVLASGIYIGGGLLTLLLILLLLVLVLR